MTDREPSKRLLEYLQGTRATTDGKPPETFDTAAPGPVKDNGQHTQYWVLSEAERAKGFVRPYRNTYVHGTCGTATTMGRALSETYARDPKFYGATFCVACGGHFPVDEFRWDDGEVLGS